MPDEQSIDAILDDLFQNLCSMSLSKEPVDLNDRIVLPVFKVSIAFGGDAGLSRKDEAIADSARCVAGAVAGISPAAVLDIKKAVYGQRGVRVLSLAASESSL